MRRPAVGDVLLNGRPAADCELAAIERARRGARAAAGASRPGDGPDAGVRVSARSYWQLYRDGRLRGRSPDTAAPRPPGPRCGRVLALDGRFERGGVPGDPGDPPRCGRPAGHPPTAGGLAGCRSE